MKLIIFDADGTLYKVEAGRAYAKVYSFLSQKTGKSVDEIESMHRNFIDEVKNSTDVTLRNHDYTLSRLSEQLGTDEVLSVFNNAVKSAVTPISGVDDALKKLSEKFTLAVASDSNKDRLEMKLDFAVPSWRTVFKTVVACERAGTMKPSTKFYEPILTELNIPAEDATMVGDSWERDLVPAKEMGMRTVLVNPQKQGNPDLYAPSLLEAIEKL